MCRLIKQNKLNYWNLFNPYTKELLTSNSLKEMGKYSFINRPDSWDEYGVLDLGTDFEHCSIWLNHVKEWLDKGFYLCSLNKNIGDIVICDCYNIGFDIDEKGKVIPFR